MHKRARLLYLINSFVMGGAEKAMVRILSGLDRNKYDIMAVSLQNRTEKILPELEDINVSIVRLSAANNYDIRVVHRLYKLLRAFKPDVLICSLFHSTILGRLAGTVAGIPIIINWEHNEDLGSAWRRFINRSTTALSDKIFCDSEKVRAQVLRQLCPKGNSVKTIPIGGVDLSKYSCSQRKQNSVVEIGTVGMLTRQKGFTYLVEAAKLVLEKHSNVRFSIVGDGPQFKYLQDLINKLRLAAKVNLLGFRRDIHQLLPQWDIYVQPSLWEGLCMTVVEAMACGLPVIASSVGGIPESVVDGKNGFLIPPQAPSLLAAKILELIENPGLRTAMGRHSRKIAEEKYGLRKMCKTIEESIDDSVKAKLQSEWNQQEESWQPYRPLDSNPTEKLRSYSQADSATDLLRDYDKNSHLRRGQKELVR